MKIYMIQGIQKKVKKYSPVTKLSNDIQAILQVHNSRDPQLDDKRWIDGVQKDLPVELLYCD